MSNTIHTYRYIHTYYLVHKHADQVLLKKDHTYIHTCYLVHKHADQVHILATPYTHTYIHTCYLLLEHADEMLLKERREIGPQSLRASSILYQSCVLPHHAFNTHTYIHYLVYEHAVQVNLLATPYIHTYIHVICYMNTLAKC
jgi:hypothetical protein